MTRSELTFKGQDVLRIGVYRTWHESAHVAASCGGMYGKHSIVQDGMTGFLDRVELAEAVMEASGAPDEYQIAIQTADNNWHDYDIAYIE